MCSGLPLSAGPTTGPTALEDDVVGEEIAYDPESLVIEAYLSQEICATSGNKLHAGIPVDVHAVPVLRGERAIAVVELHTNRMGVRAPGALEDAYLETATLIMHMVSVCQFPTPGDKPVPWGTPRVGDGSLLVNTDGMVTFASPNAMSAFRRLGWGGDVLGDRLPTILTSFSHGRREPVEEVAPPLLAQHRVRETELETLAGAMRIRSQPLWRDERSGRLVRDLPRRHRSAHPRARTRHQGCDHPGDPPPGQEQSADRGGAAAAPGSAQQSLRGGVQRACGRPEAGGGDRRGPRDPLAGLRHVGELRRGRRSADDDGARCRDDAEQGHDEPDRFLRQHPGRRGDQPLAGVHRGRAERPRARPGGSSWARGGYGRSKRRLPQRRRRQRRRIPGPGLRTGQRPEPGLSIVITLVADLHGTFDIEPGPGGVGTSARIAIPLD
jgi:hypothetical protein